MDNLRSLNSSLPAPSSTRRQRSGHDKQSSQASQANQQALLQAFKTAALSVTNLYRAAATENSTASYSDGYRDALEDLVEFLDQEEIGLMDGEGWRIRQYLADRLAQSPAATGGQQTGTDGSDDEGGEVEEEKRARSSSPVMQTKAAPQEQQQQPGADAARSVTPPRSGSAPPQQTDPPHVQFTFQSGHPYPVPHLQDIDMEGQPAQQQQAMQRTPRLRHGMLRVNNHSHNRSATSLAGGKRKLPFVDFFDITGFGNGKDGTSGGGGGKRNRLI